MMSERIPEMTEAQEETLQCAIWKADALNNAYTVVTRHPSPDPYAQAAMLEVLQGLGEEAEADVARLKREYGFKDC